MTTEANMRRGHAQRLSKHEVAMLKMDISAGLSNDELSRKYNMSVRNIQRHRAIMAGKYHYAPPTGPVHPVYRICWVEGCFEHIHPDDKFCEKHQYRRPANAAQLMAARA